MKGKDKTDSGGEPEPDVRAKGFMKVKEAQGFLSISETTLYRMMTQGKLTPFKVGRCTLLSRVQVENLARAS
jgi:excisionase family DNA binding protein